MSKNITIELPQEIAELVHHALRIAADIAQDRIESGEANCAFDQPGQLRWAAKYIEHKVRDAG